MGIWCGNGAGIPADTNHCSCRGISPPELYTPWHGPSSQFVWEEKMSKILCIRQVNGDICYTKLRELVRNRKSS